MENRFMLPFIIIIGSSGFFLFLIWEIVSWRKAGKIFAFFFQALCFLLGLLAHTLVLTGPRFPRSSVELMAGILLLVSSTYLLYRSLWADLPKNVYSYPAKPLQVSRHGTYSLMRHPGLWWYALFLVGLYLVSGAQWLTGAGPVWWLADFIVILVEDLYLYPRIFKDYLVYKKEVPMLIPGVQKIFKP